MANILELAHTVPLRTVQRTSTEPPLAALRLSGSNRQTGTEEGSADWVLEAKPLNLWLCPAVAGCLHALVGLVQSATAGVDTASPPPPGVPSCYLLLIPTQSTVVYSLALQFSTCCKARTARPSSRLPKCQRAVMAAPQSVQ